MPDKNDIAAIRDFVMDERKKSVSDREWRHRLTGYGLAIEESGSVRWVKSILRGDEVCVII